jgi:cellulose synthase/poly-beta-1,6-N-acetylglucosamine synthase-like glycosyltransferase
MLFTILLLFFLFVTLLQILIWVLFPARWLWGKIAPPSPPSLLPVTVLICARNEAANLSKNLPIILEQHYPGSVEVLVIDDDSTDATPAVLAALQQKYPLLNTLRIHPKTHLGKKIALEQGIRAAKYPWLVFTDADCAPTSQWWLQHLLALTNIAQPGIVLGYAPMEKSHHWLNGWARFETIYTAMQYFATAYMGWPFMGVGRNMAMHRSLFDAAGGFSSHLHITGGDDDLLVNSVAKGSNTHICTLPASFVYSAAKTTLKGWVAQKRRHITAGTGYKTWHNMVLGGVAFTHSVHYGLAVILFIGAPEWSKWVLLAYLLRQAVVIPVYARAFVRLQEQSLRPFIPFYDGVMAIWLGAVAPVLLLLGRKKQW